jgi:TatD DNase family protein
LRLFDSHCHLDFPPLAEAMAEVAARARAAEVDRVLVPGVDPAQWARAEGLVGEGLALRFAVGLHPFRLLERDDAELSEELGRLPEVAERLGAVAVGELGWDRRLRARGVDVERQDRWARAQLRVARELGLPVILHVVRSHGAALDALEEGTAGVVHAYGGAAELVPKYLAKGLSLSFAPPVLRSPRIAEALKRVPLDRLLIETDGPDMSPAPDRAGEPADVRAVLFGVAAIRGELPEVVAEATARNAERLFSAPPAGR